MKRFLFKITLKDQTLCLDSLGMIQKVQALILDDDDENSDIPLLKRLYTP